MHDSLDLKYVPFCQRFQRRWKNSPLSYLMPLEELKQGSGQLPPWGFSGTMTPFTLQVILLRYLSEFTSVLNNRYVLRQFYLYVCFVSVYACVPRACLVPVEVTGDNESGWLWPAMWVLGIKRGSSVRGASTLTCWAISPAPIHRFKKNY